MYETYFNYSNPVFFVLPADLNMFQSFKRETQKLKSYPTVHKAFLLINQAPSSIDMENMTNKISTSYT